MAQHNNERKEKRRRGRKATMKNHEQTPESGSHNSILIKLSEESTSWYKYFNQAPDRDSTITLDGDSSQLSSNDLCEKYRSMANSIYRRELELFGKEDASDEKWIEGTIRKGTLKDRIAAMSVVVSSHPVHKIYAIEGLLQMTGSTDNGGQTNSRVADLAAEALEDLFLNTLLPRHRKLCNLSHRPLDRYEDSKIVLSPRILLLWRFEEMVKEKFHSFIKGYLNYTLREGLETSKNLALRIAAKLLSSVPEGEAQLLALMVNKLGDPSKKVAAAAGHQLRLVIRDHPNMKAIVSREVQQLAHRPKLSARALYNCITFLNQLKLSKYDEKDAKPAAPNDELLATSLVNTYFRLFEAAVSNPTSKSRDTSDATVKSRLLCALLAGVNRAHPYLKKEDQDMDEHIEALYRVVHKTPPTASIQALLLLFHVVVGMKLNDSKHRKDASKHRKDAKGTHSDKETASRARFYRALYSTLSAPTFLSSGRHMTMLFNLLYKAMKYDKDSGRVVAFAKRILCTSIHSSVSCLCSSIFLINEISKYHPALLTCIQDAPDEKMSAVVLDPLKRDPRAAIFSSDDDENAAASWELSLASHHVHPSASKFAASAGHIAYTGDPLKDFSFAPFLDKLAYRNPKSAKRIAQREKSTSSVAKRRKTNEGDSMRESIPANDKRFLRQKNIDVQDEFLHKFFSERARRDDMKGIVRGSKASKENDDDDAEVEAIDAVERGAVDQTFESFEQKWASDSEEEEFVHALAEKMMQNSAGGMAVDIDGDDDLDDWGDLHTDDDSTDAADASVNQESFSDGDAFMDDDSDEDDDNDVM